MQPVFSGAEPPPQPMCASATDPSGITSGAGPWLKVAVTGPTSLYGPRTEAEVAWIMSLFAVLVFLRGKCAYMRDQLAKWRQLGKGQGPHRSNQLVRPQ